MPSIPIPLVKKTMASRIWRSKNMTGYFFILPALLFLIAVIIFPMIYNLMISFQQVDIYTLSKEKPFIGLKNYKDVFLMPVFYKALGHTLYFTVLCVAFQFIIGFALALLFAKKFALSGLARGLLMLCWLVPVLVSATIWKWIFAGDSSALLNYFLMQAHLINEPVSWMTSLSGSKWSIIVTNVWRHVPFCMILLATALTTLPQDIMEAASIDGANRWQRFFHITVPWIKPSIVGVLTLSFIYTFNTFDLVYIMTGGGPVDATEILTTFSYRLAFTNTNFGHGAAVANVMLVLLLIIVGAVNLKFVSKDEVIS